MSWRVGRVNRRRKVDMVLDLNHDPPTEVVGPSTLQPQLQPQQPQASPVHDDDDVVECSPRAFQEAKLNAERRRVRRRTIVSLDEVVGIIMTLNSLESESLQNSHDGNRESSDDYQNQAIINADPLIINADPLNQTVINADPLNQMIINSDPLNPTIISSNPLNQTIINSDPQNQTIIIGDPQNPIITNGDPQNQIIINGESENRTIIIGHSENQTIIIGDPPNQTIISNNHPNQCIINGHLYVNLDSRSHFMIDETVPKSPEKNSPEPVFTCPICMAPLVEEMSTKCGHIFCKDCIKTAIAANGKCPTCRKKVTRNSLIRVFLPSNN